MPSEAASAPAALLVTLLNWALVAGAFLGPALLLFLIPKPARFSRGQLTGEQGPRFLFEVALVALAALGLEGAITRVFAYGIEGEALAQERLRTAFLVKFALCPVILFIIVFVPWMISRTRPAQLGLTTRLLRTNLCLGYALWLVITPIVLSVFWIVLRSVQRERHPVELLIAEFPDLTTWIAVLGVVLIAAPLIEELIHRGVIQPWLMRHPLAADLMIAAIFLGVLSHVVQELWDDSVLSSAWLLVELVVLGPVYIELVFLTRRQTELSGALRGLFASAAFFAALHPWPTPIPLFLLALALGWLRYWTGSIVAPITAHFLFNVVGLLPLILRQTGAW